MSVLKSNEYFFLILYKEKQLASLFFSLYSYLNHQHNHHAIYRRELKKHIPTKDFDKLSKYKDLEIEITINYKGVVILKQIIISGVVETFGI